MSNNSKSSKNINKASARNINITSLRRSSDISTETTSSSSETSSSNDLMYTNNSAGFKYKPRTPPIDNPRLIIKRRLSSSIDEHIAIVNSDELISLVQIISTDELMSSVELISIVDQS